MSGREVTSKEALEQQERPLKVSSFSSIFFQVYFLSRFHTKVLLSFGKILTITRDQFYTIDTLPLRSYTSADHTGNDAPHSLPFIDDTNTLGNKMILPRIIKRIYEGEPISRGWTTMIARQKRIMQFLLSALYHLFRSTTSRQNGTQIQRVALGNGRRSGLSVSSFRGFVAKHCATHSKRQRHDSSNPTSLSSPYCSIFGVSASESVTMRGIRSLVGSE